MLQAFFAFVNCIINKKKTNIEYKKIRKASVSFFFFFFFKNIIRIESARVRESNKDGRDVFLADS